MKGKSKGKRYRWNPPKEIFPRLQMFGQFYHWIIEVLKMCFFLCHFLSREKIWENWDIFFLEKPFPWLLKIFDLRSDTNIFRWSTSVLGPLHVLWQVSLGCWVTWSISSWQKYYKSVFFPKDEWCVAELLFLSLNNWSLSFLQNECSQSSQIYLSLEQLRKMFTF